MVEVNEETRKKIYTYVRRDLEPSYWGVSWRVATSLIIGGFLSMIFCGQFGIGFSEMARNFNHAIHAGMGAVQCAIICGFTFAIAPVLVLRVICSGILFRKIIREYGMVQAALLVPLGIFMYTQGTLMNELINISIWASSAYITYRLLGLIVDQAHQLFRSPNEI